MLLGSVKGEFVGGKVVVDLAGDEALEAAEGLSLSESFVHPTFDVGAGSRVAGHAGDDDAPERGVGLAVATPVEAMSLLFAAAGVDRCGPAEVGKGGFAAEP